MLEMTLYGQQHAFVLSEKRFAVLVGGIGSGKTRAGCARALLAANGRVGTSVIPVPNTGVVTAPTYTMLRDATLRTFLEVANGIVAYFHRTEMRAQLKNGSEILFRSADDADRLRGPNISWWHGDEAAYYTRDVWRVMIGRLRQGGRLGYAWLTTTPKGRNWIYQEFVQKRRADYQLYHLRTSENPFISAAYYEMLTDAYAGDFARQELDGEFVAFEGLVYPEFMPDVHVVRQLPAEFAQVVAGVDWGYVHPGVINVYGVDGDGRMWLIHEEVARKRRIEEWVTAAVEAQARYGIMAFYCDTSEPTYIRQFADAGLNALPANKEVLPGIQAVKARLAARPPRLLYAAWCRHNIAEKAQYQWAENRDGFKDAPKKIHDDANDAERYAVQGVASWNGGETYGHLEHGTYTTLAGDY